MPVAVTATEPTTSTPSSGEGASNTAYIFNVGRGGTRHVTWDSPAGGERTLLEDFIETLRSINLKGYIVQGAMFSGESYNIFIDTEDEDWHEQIGCLG